MQMNVSPDSVSSTSWIVQMLGWSMAQMARASRRNRSLAPASLVSARERNLRATVRPSLVSSAL
jgi:hypothetical protein